MRLDCFLPFVRKTRPGTTRKPPGLPVRLATALLPKRLLTAPNSAKPGPLRKFLKKLGPTWNSAPFRRISQALCLIAFLALEGRLAWTALLLPLPILVQLVLSLGLALFLSALTVHFRDIQNILIHVLQIWFFTSPVIYAYPPEGTLHRLLFFNPMTHVLVSYQEVLFFGRFHHLRGLAVTALVALLVFAAGARLFDRLRDTLAEEV